MLCHEEKISDYPFYKLYSDGALVGNYKLGTTKSDLVDFVERYALGKDELAPVIGKDAKKDEL